MLIRTRVRSKVGMNKVLAFFVMKSESESYLPGMYSIPDRIKKNGIWNVNIH